MVDGIRYHHERFDGKRYPEGLSDTEILRFGRVAAAMSLAAADATSGVIDIKESEKRCECFERK